MAEYTQDDLEQARHLAPDANTKAQERIAQALRDRERVGERNAQSAIVEAVDLLLQIEECEDEGL